MLAVPRLTLSIMSAVGGGCFYTDTCARKDVQKRHVGGCVFLWRVTDFWLHNVLISLQKIIILFVVAGLVKTTENHFFN